MTRPLSLSRRLVLTFALVAAWIPAAMYASPGTRAAASAAPVVEAPAAGEAGYGPVELAGA